MTRSDTELDTQSDGKSGAVSNHAEETENNKKAGIQNYNDNSDLTRADQADSDNHPGKTGQKNAMRTDALLFNLFEAAVTINTGLNLSPVDNDSLLVNKETIHGEAGQSGEQPGVEAGSENGLKTGALLFDLINGSDRVNTDNLSVELSGFRIGQAINDIKRAAEQSEGNAEVSAAGNGAARRTADPPPRGQLEDGDRRFPPRLRGRARPSRSGAAVRQRL